MPFLVVSGFYPEPNPDNSLYYDTTVSQEWRNAALARSEFIRRGGLSAFSGPAPRQQVDAHQTTHNHLN